MPFSLCRKRCLQSQRQIRYHNDQKNRLLSFIVLFGNQLLAQKAVIGVTDVVAAAQNISCEGWELMSAKDCNENLSKGFTAMLETAIVKSGKMDVIERTQWDTVLKEQPLRARGIDR